MCSAPSWGTFVSPQAPVALPRLVVLLLQGLVFGVAAAALVATGHRTLALVFLMVGEANAPGVGGRKVRSNRFTKHLGAMFYTALERKAWGIHHLEGE